MQIVTREQWGATVPRSSFVRMPSLPTQRLWIHHSADDRQGAAAVRAHEHYHVNTRGWRGIAYNFLVGADGTIFEGRGAGIVGGATAGDNTTSHAICLLGNFEAHDTTPAQWQALVDLVRHGRDAGWWVPTCGGHRDAPGAQTACPGRHVYSRPRHRGPAPPPGAGAPVRCRILSQRCCVKRRPFGVGASSRPGASVVAHHAGSSPAALRWLRCPLGVGADRMSGNRVTAPASQRGSACKEVDMAKNTRPVTVDDIGGLTAQLRDLSGRYARFEDVPEREVDAYMARKRDVLGRIDRDRLL